MERILFSPQERKPVWFSFFLCQAVSVFCTAAHFFGYDILWFLVYFVTLYPLIYNNVWRKRNQGSSLPS